MINFMAGLFTGSVIFVGLTLYTYPVKFKKKEYITQCHSTFGAGAVVANSNMNFKKERKDWCNFKFKLHK